MRASTVVDISGGTCCLPGRTVRHNCNSRAHLAASHLLIMEAAINLPQHGIDSIRADVTELIAKQRILRLVEGGRFIKYTPKGQRIKDRYWICKLSPNHKNLHFGDLEEGKELHLDDLPNTISVSSIKRLLLWKDCPHTKDGHMKKAAVDLAFSIVYEQDHEEHLNFVAVDQKTFCYWTDGLNTLLKNNMSSEEFQKDMQILSKIELKMRSMN